MIEKSVRPADEIQTVIDEYGDMLFRICFSMLKNKYDAEDAVQDTIIKYMERSPGFESAEHQKAWLIKIAGNRCKDILRFKVKYSYKQFDGVNEMLGENENHEILDALMSLPQKYRIVLILYYVEGYRTTEIAKIIRRTNSAVKMRLKKGRELLSDLYRKEYM